MVDFQGILVNILMIEKTEITQHVALQEAFLELQPQFDNKGRYYLRDYKRHRICLYKKTWEIKTAKPEREWAVKYNFDKVEGTLKNPDFIIKSTKNEDSVLFYKWYDRYNIRDNITTDMGQYMVVVVVNFKKVQTIYTSINKKEGEQIWPESRI